MKKLLLAAVMFSGCAGIAYAPRAVPMGFLYDDVKVNQNVTQNTLGTKQGEACSTSILGLVTTGDASVSEAAKKAGVTKVASVDNTFNNILGIVATYCTVVTGE